jgi:hypothetical protein
MNVFKRHLEAFCHKRLGVNQFQINQARFSKDTEKSLSPDTLRLGDCYQTIFHNTSCLTLTYGILNNCKP